MTNRFGQSPKQAATGWGRESKRSTVEKPDDSEWCPKCEKVGLLPVAYWTPKGRPQEGLAACDCVWGEYMMAIDRRYMSYYRFPDAIINRDAKTALDIKRTCRENSQAMWTAFTEKRDFEAAQREEQERTERESKSRANRQAATDAIRDLKAKARARSETTKTVGAKSVDESAGGTATVEPRSHDDADSIGSETLESETTAAPPRRKRKTKAKPAGSGARRKKKG